MTNSNEYAADLPTAVAAESQPVSEKRYDKVGGWLMFFCISLIVLNPLLMLGVGGYSVVSVLPVMSRFPGLAVVTFVDLLISVALAGFSLYAGLSLWRRKAGAVKLATTFLIAGAVYTVVGSLLPFLAGLPKSANPALLDSALQSWRGLLYYGIWMNYLRNSKRVRATEGL